VRQRARPAYETRVRCSLEPSRASVINCSTDHNRSVTLAAIAGVLRSVRCTRVSGKFKLGHYQLVRFRSVRILTPRRVASSITAPSLSVRSTLTPASL